MTAEELWQELEGARVQTHSTTCLYCGGHDGILRRHHCKHELELYCDWCERWTGFRVTLDQMRVWVEPRNETRPAKAQIPVQWLQGCPGTCPV